MNADQSNLIDQFSVFIRARPRNPRLFLFLLLWLVPALAFAQTKVIEVNPRQWLAVVLNGKVVQVWGWPYKGMVRYMPAENLHLTRPPMPKAPAPPRVVSPGITVSTDGELNSGVIDLSHAPRTVGLETNDPELAAKLDMNGKAPTLSGKAAPPAESMPDAAGDDDNCPGPDCPRPRPRPRPEPAPYPDPAPNIDGWHKYLIPGALLLCALTYLAVNLRESRSP